MMAVFTVWQPSCLLLISAESLISSVSTEQQIKQNKQSHRLKVAVLQVPDFSPYCLISFNRVKIILKGASESCYLKSLTFIPVIV